MSEFTEYLFSYGTLQREEVQLSTFNRLLEGHSDALVGHVITLIPIRDQEVPTRAGDTHYRNAAFTGNDSDTVEGTAYKVSLAELELADKYEASANYGRVHVTLRSGRNSWVYNYNRETDA